MDIAKYDVGNDGSQWDSRFTRKGCRWISRIANAGLAVDYDLAPPNGAREEGLERATNGDSSRSVVTASAVHLPDSEYEV